MSSEAPPEERPAVAASLPAARARERRASAPFLATAAFLAAAVAFNTWWIVSARARVPLDVDEAGYISFALQHTDALRTGGAAELWSSVRAQAPFAPLLPVVTVPVLLVFGGGVVSSILMQDLFLIVLGLAAYGLGARVGGRRWMGALAAVVTISTPGVIDFSRAYHLALPSAALFTAAHWALVRSERFTSVRWSVVWGVVVGLTLLARTMMVAFVAGLLVAAIWLVFSERVGRPRRLRNLAIGGLAACAVALPWFVSSFRLVYDYLFSYGYGASSAAYGPDRGVFSWSFWTRDVRVEIIDGAFLVPFSATLLVVAVLGIAARVRSRARTERVPVRSEVVVLAIVAAGGYLALVSTRNQGYGFWIPLVPVFVVLAIAALRSLPPRVIAIFAAALIGASSVGVISKADPAGALSSRHRVVVAGFTILDERSLIERSVDAIGRGGSSAWRLEEWLAPARQLSQWIDESRPRPAAVYFASRDPLFNPNTVKLASLLDGRAAPPLVQIDASRGDTIDAYRAVLSSSGPAVFVSGDPAQNEFPPVVDQSRAEAAARATGFEFERHVSLPDGRAARIWIRSR